jgi:hypothetical protein
MTDPTDDASRERLTCLERTVRWSRLVGYGVLAVLSRFSGACP